jgi:predicted kinase
MENSAMIEDLNRYDIVLIVGNYGSGKSSLAKEYFRSRKRVDRHEIRHHLKAMLEHGARWTQEDWDEDLEGLIKRIEYDLIVHLLERDQKIVIDNTSLTEKSRRRYIEHAKKFHKTIACIYLNRDSATLLEQNRSREYPVPDSVIVQHVARTEVPTVNEGFAQVLIL